MSEDVYRNVLAQLVAGEGGAQAVASLLHVPEKTLERWIQGRARMPLRAFLRALDVAIQQEQPLAAAEPLTFRAGPATASCAQCGGEQFRLADPSTPHTYRSVLACLRCRTPVAHHELVTRLAQEVALRAGTYAVRARARRKTRLA